MFFQLHPLNSCPAAHFAEENGLKWLIARYHWDKFYLGIMKIQEIAFPLRDGFE